MTRSIFIGNRFMTARSGMCEVIGYEGCNRVKVKFDNTGYEVWARSASVTSGCILDKLAANNGCVGYIGVGHYHLCKDGENSPEYKKWYQMISRCYIDRRLTSYTDCSVCDEWHNFQNFADWMNTQTYYEGWVLDKDLLIPGNRIYRPEACCLIPQEINNIIILKKRKKSSLPMGVSRVGHKYRAVMHIGRTNKHLGYYTSVKDARNAYLTEKQKHITDVANKWRTLIGEKTYIALINYITLTQQ